MQGREMSDYANENSSEMKSAIQGYGKVDEEVKKDNFLF